MKTKCVFISGGGTGGHLYPALVLGRALRDADPGLEIVFIGSRRAAERRILAAQNIRSISMSIEGLKGRGLKSLRGLVLLPGAFLRSLSLLVRLKPGLVVGVGGYSSGPVVLPAAWMGIPSLIMEQHVRPGFTNRILARCVKRAGVAFDGGRPCFRGRGVHLGDQLRIELGRAREIRCGGAGVAELLEGEGAAKIGRGVFRREHDGVIEIGERAPVVAEQAVGYAAVAIGKRIARCQDDGVAIVSLGLVESAKLAFGIAAIVIGDRMVVEALVVRGDHGRAAFEDSFGLAAEGL